MDSAKVGRTLRSALTVGELITELQRLPADSVPVFVCDYGDHCHTQQALPVRSVRAPENAEYLADCPGYSQSGVALRERDEEDLEDGEPAPGDYRDFVIFSMSRM